MDGKGGGSVGLYSLFAKRVVVLCKFTKYLAEWGLDNGFFRWLSIEL